MKEVDFINEVKKHIVGEENGDLLIDFTALDKALPNTGFSNIEKALDAFIIKTDKEELAKKLGCSADDCIFLDNSVSDLRRYSVGTNIYTVDKINNIEKIATFNESKTR